MRMELGFRLSSYLTLGLATLCLGHAEQVLVPAIAVFIGPMLALLALAYLAEGRWSLPIRASNWVGLGIAALSGFWITLCIIRPGPWPLQGVPFPLVLLPYLGPFLTVLMVAKLFRPKRAADLWVLHGMALLQVALGCVLASDFPFGLLLFAYAVCALWFLAQFYTQREQQGRPPVAVGPPPSRLGGLRRRLGSYPIGRWTLAVLAVGVLLFLLIPRFGATQWHLLGQLGGPPTENVRPQVGFAELIDLNRTGTLKVTNEVALYVRVTDAQGRPKGDLGPQQRWRGAVLDRYHDGRWLSSSSSTRWPDRGFLENFGPRWAESLSLSPKLPDLGERQFFVDFTFDPHSLGGLILAEPVVLYPGNPAVPVGPQPEQPEFPDARFLEAESTLFLTRFRNLHEISYRQVVVPLEEPDLSLPVLVNARYQEEVLLAQRGFSLKEWTEQLLRDLAARSAYGLTPADLEYEERPQGRVLKPARHEKAARALCGYLATSGEYTYSLNLRTHDRRLDPVEDFLRHTKQGHCNRFAAGLTLMLRSQGIPARIVTGFRGGQHQGDGKYAIRQSDAHSWVEALITRPQPIGVSQHWLTLDPTTSIEAPAGAPLSPAWWVENGKDHRRTAWREFVVEYDQEQQSGLWESWRQLATDRDWRALAARVPRAGRWLAPVAGVLLAIWLLRRFRPGRGRRSAAGRSEVVFYNRLLAILARRCRLRPAPTQTPREFGEAARRLLRERHGTAELAELPARVAELFYRVHYGCQPLPREEEEELNRQLGRLDGALALPPKGLLAFLDAAARRR